MTPIRAFDVILDIIWFCEVMFLHEQRESRNTVIVMNLFYRGQVLSVLNADGVDRVPVCSADQSQGKYSPD